jgi:hypothetical protein
MLSWERKRTGHPSISHLFKETDEVSLYHILQDKFDINGTVHRECILLSITNKMQRYTVFFITVNALHVSGGFSAHH